MTNSKFSKSIRAAGAASLLAFSTVSLSAINPISDDFESYGVGGVPSATDFLPWFGFSDNGGFPGGYTFIPSTSGPQITALGYNGVDNHYLNFYANYDNRNVHDRVGCSPCSPNLQENIFVFREQTFTSADTANGDTWVFKFDYRDADVPPAGDTEVAAYIRVFDPIFNILAEVKLDTKGQADWTNGRLAVTLDPNWASGFFQIGFTNAVGNDDDSGVFYDNVELVKADPAEVAVSSVQDLFGTTWAPIMHPNHQGQFLSLGSLVDDIIRVDVMGAATPGDPANIDTSQIVESTLRFGPNLAQTSIDYPASTGLNLDGDGLDDARFNFVMSEVQFQCSDVEGTVSGDLATGGTFAGVASFTTDCNAQCHEQ